jgi:hypothetical protein
VENFDIAQMSVLQERKVVRTNKKHKRDTNGIKGHISKDFWTREENRDERSKNWKKPSKEKAVIAVESKKMRRLFSMVGPLKILKQR